MEKALEFEISGCLYTGQKDIDLGDLQTAFIEFVESKGWQFCGITSPLENK
jgi:hypothetical protein